MRCIRIGHGMFVTLERLTPGALNHSLLMKTLNGTLCEAGSTV